MQIKKIAIILAACLLVFTGCQETPYSIEKNGVIKAENSGEKEIEKEVAQLLTSSQDDENTSNAKEVIINTPNSIVKKYKSEKRELNINAKVILPNITQINSYTITREAVTAELLKKIVEVYFQDDAQKVIYDEELLEYRFGNNQSIGEEYFTLSDTPNINIDVNRIELSGHKKNLCPWDSNIIIENNKQDIDLTAAENKCRSFIEAIGLNGYDFYSYTPYGSTIGEPYNKFDFYKTIDGIPVDIPYQSSGFEFSIADSEIYAISGSIYGERLEEKNISLLSLDSAINILTTNIDNVFIPAFDGNIYQDLADELGHINTLNIMQIRLEYVAKETETGYLLEPAWRFVFSPNENYLDTNRLLAINAVTGEVVYEM